MDDEPFQITEVVRKLEETEDSRGKADMTNIREEVNNTLTRFKTIKPAAYSASVTYIKAGNNEKEEEIKGDSTYCNP